MISAADLFEAINVGTTTADFPGLDLPADVYAANVYPAEEVPGFAGAVTEWFSAAGREDCFERFTDHSIDVLRMNNYRMPAADAQLEKDQLGMGAHTDYGIVTVLWADRGPGLGIHAADGSWYPVM